ncbi:MAG: hypothetical protein Aurels2KO_51260 [Aureliella sp.]
MNAHLASNYLVCVLASLISHPAVYGSEPDLYEQMVTKGVGPIKEQHVVLDRPILAGIDGAEERQTAAEVLTKRIGWARFAKDSVFAPVAIDIDAVKDSAGTRIAHSIHCAFIVHAELEHLRDQELLESILVAGEDKEKEDDEGKGEELPPEVLAENDIEAPNNGESYGQVTFPLFNRVEVSGVIHAVRVEQENAIGVAWQFDDRFSGSHASAWRRLSKNNLGHLVVGNSVPYTGCGGYMMVQEISPGLLLVESRMVMHEPKDWFNGSQFLRSKLPPGLQENARSFRRKLAEARKQ